MSSDFCAGYLSGALGIIIGNPLDVIKVQLQAGHSRDASAQSQLSRFEKASSLVRGLCDFQITLLSHHRKFSNNFVDWVIGAAAPILGYGALNALLFVAYNRSLMAMDSNITDPTNPDGVPLYKIWIAGAAGGLASWSISSPTEFIKCRAQLDSRPEISSWTVAKDIYRNRGWRGLYYGGAITSARDSIGYGF
jgi:solute carrier family 25 carnitine/acylcarnitine transporter 20/29